MSEIVLKNWLAATQSHERFGDPLIRGFWGRNSWPLSNMSRILTKFEGHTYPTSEHAHLVAQALCYGLTEEAEIWHTAYTSTME